MQRLLANIKKPLFRSIMLSYISISLLLLACTSIGLYFNYRSMKKLSLDYGQEQVSSISTRIEEHLTTAMKTLRILSAKNILKEFSLYTDQETSLNVSRMTVLREELSSAISNSEYRDIMVWFDTNETVTSAKGHRYNQAALPSFLQEMDLTKEEFMDLLDYEGVYGFRVMPNGEVWIMHSAYTDHLERYCVIIVRMNFAMLFSPIIQQNRENIYQLYYKDQLLYSSPNVTDSSFAPLLEIKTGSQIRIGNNLYLPIRKDLNAAQFSLTMGIPADKLFSGLHIFIYVALLELLGAIVMSLVFSSVTTRHMYAPVQKMIELLGTRDSHGFEETYSNLMEGLTHLKEDYATLSQDSRNYSFRQSLQGIVYHLKKISEEAVPWSQEAAEVFTSFFESTIGPGSLTTSLIHIPKEWENSFGPESVADPTSNMKGFILSNVMTELLSDDFPSVLVPIDDNYLLFIRSDAASRDELLQHLDKAREFYQQTLHIDILILFGQVQEDYRMIPQQYRLLEEELRYTLFWKKDDSRHDIICINANENLPKDALPQSSLETSRKLLNFLDIGDYESAYDTMDQLLLQLPRDRRYLTYSTYRMYGLISTITMMLDMQSDDDEFWETLNYEDRLYHASTMYELLRETRSIFDSIIEYNMGRSSSNEPGWLRQVEKYINDNYSDINLSVSSIADHFHLSVPHLSRTFKSYMDCGLLEYIQRFRVSKARELLDQGVSVTEAAERVGYAEAKALRRAFKRYEGVNPSDYRKTQP